MSRDFYKGLILGFCLMFIGTTFFMWLTLQDDKVPAPKPEISLEQKYVDKMQVLLGYIDTYYINGYDADKLLEGSYKGLVDSLGDKYSTYYSAEVFDTVKDSMKGTFCGIGVQVGVSEEGYPHVSKVLRGGPAIKAGVQKDDLIIEADGVDLKGLDIDDAVSHIRGEKGTAVNIKVKRGEKILEFSLVRDEVENETVIYEMLENNIGYVKVVTFEAITDTQFDTAVTELSNQGMKGLVIDIRSNPGGYLFEATSMLDRILPKNKLLVYQLDKNGKKRETYSQDDKTIDVPISVIINGGSASSSEVFTGCLKDYDKAVIVGETSFGKGIVQTQFSLDDDSAIKLTTAYYYSPKGINIHGKGIVPDVEIVDNPDTEVDEQLQAAIEVLTK